MSKISTSSILPMSFKNLALSNLKDGGKHRGSTTPCDNIGIMGIDMQYLYSCSFKLVVFID